MSLNESNAQTSSAADEQDVSTSSSKVSNSLIVRINKDSDDNLQALFDSVLNPGDSKRPLQVPFRMRKLPNSFFNPPAKSPSVSHSRANSSDSAYDGGSQQNVDQSVSTTPSTAIQASGIASRIAQNPITPKGLSISHSRAHSSPASLQQNYNVHTNNINSDIRSCTQDGTGSSFTTNLVGFNCSGNESDRSSAGHEGMQSLQPFHMKQRSYDVVSPIQLQNELGALPPGWEQAKTNDGQIYYLNHSTKTTQWEDPRIQFKHKAQQSSATNSDNCKNAIKDAVGVIDSLGPLPEGWEQAYTDSGDVYFINHINRTTSWNDPRIPEFLHKSLKSSSTEMSWLSVDKNQFFKQKPELNVINGQSLQIDPFLSGDHVRQESSDSGLSLASNTFAVNSEFIPQIDDSMDCINENTTLNGLDGLDCPDNLVSSLQIEDNICNEMFNDVERMLTSKPDNLEWYKIN